METRERENTKLDPGTIVLWFVVFLFSLSFHESAHAWTSSRFGDDTGRLLGRITLNPIPHVDPLGTILLPLIGFISGVPLFGWAKPVPVNPLLWREKTKANILTSAAGPISNLILLIVSFAIAKALLLGGVLTPNYDGTLYDLLMPVNRENTPLIAVAKLLSIAMFLNLSLAVFNFIPVPPLDGSHVLESLLPYEMSKAYEQLRPYGFLLLMALLYLGVFWALFKPFANLLLYALGIHGSL